MVSRATLWLSSALLTGAVVMSAGCRRDGPSGDKPAGLPASPLAAQAPSQAPAAQPAAAPVKNPAAEAAKDPTAAAAPAPAGEAEEVPDVPAESQSVAGTITVPKARRKDVKEGDIIFLVARRSGGPPGPGSMLAVQKLVAKTFPMEFVVSSRDAMVPGTPFEGAVDIQVRVDKDGEPMTRRKGDLLGEVKGVKVGSKGVTIPLDTVLTQDATLGPPPGMPPGHP